MKISSQNETFDVVYVTLGQKKRPTLKASVWSAVYAIPRPLNFIFIQDIGIIGNLRNQGLAKATHEYCAFIDDDTIVNRSWFEQCWESLQKDPTLDIVFGITAEGGFTLGAAIGRTKNLKQKGGFPQIDSLLMKIGKFQAIVNEKAIAHHLSKGFQPFFHTLHWLMHGFNTELKFGLNNNPKYCVEWFFKSLKEKRPESAITFPLWFVKGFYCFPLMKLGELI